MFWTSPLVLDFDVVSARIDADGVSRFVLSKHQGTVENNKGQGENQSSGKIWPFRSPFGSIDLVGYLRVKGPCRNSPRSFVVGIVHLRRLYSSSFSFRTKTGVTSVGGA